MTCFRGSIVLASSLAVLVPDVAFARREPGTAEAPAAAAQPVAPSAVAPAPAPAATPAPAAAPIVVVAPVTVTPTTTTAPVERVAWEPPAPASAPAAAPAPAPVVSPTAMPPSRPAPYVPSNGKATAMLASGFGLFGSVYFFTSLSGAVIIDRAREGKYDGYTGLRTGPDKRRMNYGRALLIPVVGPFIGLSFTDSARERWAASFSGLAQATGAVLVIAGLVAKSRIRRARRYGWTAGGTTGGGAVAVYGRF